MPNRAPILASFVCAGTAAAQNVGDAKALFGNLPSLEAVPRHALTPVETRVKVILNGAVGFLGLVCHAWE